MAVIRMPRMFGGGPRPDKQPADDWDKELEAMRSVGEWLATLDDPEARFRVLTYWLWRERSDAAPRIQQWVDAVANQSAGDLSAKHGFEPEGKK